MSSPQKTLLRFSRFTTSLSEVPLLSRRAQLRGFSATTTPNSQTRSSTDNPPTGSTAAHASIPPNADSGPGTRDAGEKGSGSHTGISGPVSDSASGARDASVNSNASRTPSGQQMSAGEGRRNESAWRDSPNENVNEAHDSPREAKKDSTQATKNGQQDADPILKGRDEGPQSINAVKAAAKKK